MSARHECSECPRTFATAGGMATHKRVHKQASTRVDESTEVDPWPDGTAQTVLDMPEVSHTATGDYAHDLAMLASERRDLERRIANKVRDARRAGQLWAEIGACLGVSKQAAQQRYK